MFCLAPLTNVCFQPNTLLQATLKGCAIPNLSSPVTMNISLTPVVTLTADMDSEAPGISVTTLKWKGISNALLRGQNFPAIAQQSL